MTMYAFFSFSVPPVSVFVDGEMNSYSHFYCGSGCLSDPSLFVVKDWETKTYFDYLPACVLKLVIGSCGNLLSTCASRMS